MNLSFFHLPKRDRKDEHEKEIPNLLPEFEHNITEGGEFLDDIIRMKEQPFMLTHTEESIAPGSPVGIL